jgi:hypothetical protein
MSVFTVNEFLLPDQYENVRMEKIKEIAKIKSLRRVDYGDRLSFLFENRDTVKHQIQETIYLDGLTNTEDIEDVIRTYEPMVPRGDEISLTVFINIYNDNELRELLPKYRGIENSIRIKIDDKEINGSVIYPEKSKYTTRSIHYLKFKLDNDDKNRIVRNYKMYIVINHPQLQVEIQIPQKVIDSIIKDLH